MKYLSFVVPCYNSEKFMRKCIESLLIGNDDVEIIIVNDGSKDNTISIAREYGEKYPSIIRVVDKENGGHGSGVNKGIELATGLYFKCVDSDDWVDEEAYLKVLDTIKTHYNEGTSPDLYLTNFVFENVEEGTSHVNGSKNGFPLNQFFSWDQFKKLKLNEYMIMHSLIFKVDVLRNSGVKLLEHTFYVDNIFAYVPIPYVKTMYYIDVDFYRYYVGRVDQSVSFENMTKNYKHQLRVMKALSLAYSYEYINTLPTNQRNYLLHDLRAKSFLTFFFIYAKYDKERGKEYKAYFKEFKEKNRELYNKIRHRTIFFLPFILIIPLRRLATKIGYKVIIKSTGWN